MTRQGQYIEKQQADFDLSRKTNQKINARSNSSGYALAYA